MFLITEHYSFHTFVHDDRRFRLLKANCTDIYSSYGLLSMLQMSCELEVPLNIEHSNALYALVLSQALF